MGTKATKKEVEVGTTVRYYRNGWRIGHLEELDGKQARIRPVAAYGRDHLNRGTFSFDTSTVLPVGC